MRNSELGTQGDMSRAGQQCGLQGHALWTAGAVIQPPSLLRWEGSQPLPCTQCFILVAFKWLPAVSGRIGESINTSSHCQAQSSLEGCRTGFAGSAISVSCFQARQVSQQAVVWAGCGQAGMLHSTETCSGLKVTIWGGGFAPEGLARQR